MSSAFRPAPTPSPFQLELQRLRQLLRRALQLWLNRFFDLSLSGPGRRSVWVSGFFTLVLVANILLILPAAWPHLQALLGADHAPLRWFPEAVFYLAVAAFILVPLLVPSYFALEMASDYLTDIFELEHVDIARNFIRELALTGGLGIIHIRNGKIAEADMELPILKIGGPGLVVVEFDSVALFEKADGTPHIIGPGSHPIRGRGGASWEVHATLLDGFERFREAIDLRDHYIGNPSGQPMTIKSRSLDGIPINATDVRAVYSVRRSEDKAGKPSVSMERPYAYLPGSIEDLIYQLPVRVLMEGAEPSDLPPSWTGAMQALIRGAIGEFMSESHLSEYLASFGMPEVELAETQERTIQLEQYKVASDDPAQAAPPPLAPPKFHPRNELSGLFSQFSERFTRRAHDRGVDLHWIGVGTWQIPDKIASDIVNGQHILAWEINRENALNGSEKNFDTIANEAYGEEKARLIQKIRMTPYRDNDSQQVEKKNLLRAILTTYWEQFGEAADVCYASGEPLGAELEETIRRIEQLLFRDQHYIGHKPPSKLRPSAGRMAKDSNPPAPSTYTEEKLYRELLRRVKGDDRQAEWLIQYEQRKYPALKREQVIQYLLDHPEQFKV